MHAVCSCEPSSTFWEHQTFSKEYYPQGDPLSALEFCEAVQTILSNSESDINIGCMANFTVSGQIYVVASDDQTWSECQQMTHALYSTRQSVRLFVQTKKSSTNLSVKIMFEWDMRLFEALFLRGPAIDRSLTAKIEDLTRAVSRLILLHAHDGIIFAKEQIQHVKAAVNPAFSALQR